ncbi:hypothetical protein HVTV-2_gp127 [Haloarcula virus HVTV-2]|uniref:Uncharacterized protein n=1 Tax=Haloarcula vallismortis tailed virus 1 TaxID=1262528 RepID=L7TKI4_9CAUD|nr:hypothetical protein HVTV1_126 [Haloarcula vallismortis tailed virus 1]YP_008059166.1 hypothetical protein M200_gp103 [Halovirus HCTV-5]AGC34495.1 hypothetical protein HVTV1_126 [Haloarcula vallismortis tailed virus 1]AGM11731.1 hypothetical protein HCTV5_125 [Halovirus HCTV-5]UBF22934.1 hypothetical protein HVTV-2_gp127 [Haloarcula virus HVTV-2]
MAGVEYEVEQDAVDVIEQTENAVGKVEYPAEYASYVNYPTNYKGDSAPPFEPIFEWVKRKWGDLSTGLKNAALENVNDPGSVTKKEHQKKVAWVVVRSIGDSGTEGLYFAERSMKFGKDNAQKVAQKYENSNDPLAPYKAVVDITDLTFQHSQDIISGDQKVDTDKEESSAFDEGFLKRSGTREYTQDGEGAESGDWDGGVPN